MNKKPNIFFAVSTEGIEGQFEWRYGGHAFHWHGNLHVEYRRLTKAEVDKCRALPATIGKYDEPIYTEPNKGLQFSFWTSEPRLLVSISPETSQRLFGTIDPAKVVDNVDALIKKVIAS